jgi:hypothetical protein
MFDLFGNKKVAVFMKELECSSVDLIMLRRSAEWTYTPIHEGLFYQIQAMTTN